MGVGFERDTPEDVLSVLMSIDHTLKAMLALAQQRTQQARAAAPKSIASDRDLDGKYGDPVLRFSVRDWTGPSFKGRKFSECPADLLDLIAESLDYFARKAEETNELTNGGKPVAEFRRADAGRARGWAKRIRDGKHVPAALPATSAWADDDAGPVVPPTEWASDGSGF